MGEARDGERGWTIKWLVRLSMVDCGSDWSLEVGREAGPSRGIAVSDFGPCTPPESIQMTCDFAREAEFCEVLEPTRLNDRLPEKLPRPRLGRPPASTRHVPALGCIG